MKEAWVTQALEEKNVVKAISLVKSLQKVLTQKSSVVIVSSTISNSQRCRLEEHFDYVVTLPDSKWHDFHEDAYLTGLLFSSGLTLLDTLLYLPPNSLAVKNCDHLFDSKTSQKTGSLVGHQAVRLYPSKKMPNLLKQTFERHLFFKENKPEENNKCDSHTMTWTEDLPELLEVRSTFYVDFLGEDLIGNDDDLEICVYENESNTNSNMGCIKKFVYTLLKELMADVNDGTMVGDERKPGTTEKSCSGDPIAIVGMSCRLPASKTADEFWDLLVHGKDAMRPCPEFRAAQLKAGPDCIENAGFLSVPIDLFDAKFFGIAPTDAVFIDPQYRLLLELVWEALEDGGVNPQKLNSTNAGVFVGSWENDYAEMTRKSVSDEFFRVWSGNSIGSGAARISHLLGLTGPCVATESGCSTGMLAVHLAVRSLRQRESSFAIVGGVNLLLKPFSTSYFPSVLSTDGHCKTFDAGADGYGRGEGATVFILKRLSDAIRDNDRIHGVIRGSGVAQEGVSKSMGTPTVYTEAEAMSRALQDAQVQPATVSFLEAHGTGTKVGDPIEIAAISKVYSASRTSPLIIGSVKTNVGHTESNSGLTGMIKVILSMRHERIPRHLNFTQLNPSLDLDAIPAVLPLETMPWPKVPGKPRVAGINSFGITGTECHVILEEPPQQNGNQRVVLTEFQRPLHLLTVSAKTSEALDQLLQDYADRLSSQHDSVLPHMAYTANIGRMHFEHRAAIVASKSNDAALLLGSNKFMRGVVQSEEEKPKLCFLFTGQGSQYPDMGKELYDTCPLFQMHFDHCERILKNNLNISIAKAFWSETRDLELLQNVLYSQTGIFVVEYCMMKVWESWGVRPDAVLGHSLGEFCAAVCAGLLSLEEALALISERCRLISNQKEGRMIAVKADTSRTDTLLEQFVHEHSSTDFWLDCAAVNSADQTVLTGDVNNVEQFRDWLTAQGVKSIILKSSHAFHSRHMDLILAQYRQVVNSIFEKKGASNFPLTCDYISGVLGESINDPGKTDWVEYWIKHTREKVNFLGASKAAADKAGCHLFLEIGPNPVLSSFIILNNKQPLTCLPSMRKSEPVWSTMLNTVSKLFVTGAVNIDWERFDQFYKREKVGHLLPTYPFTGTKFWPVESIPESRQIHPLLGAYNSNPTATTIFHNKISLQAVQYLREHVIGTTIVFPGAGYIEMFLAASNAARNVGESIFPSSQRPIQLDNFRIQAALQLNEDFLCSIQTVIESCPMNEDDPSQRFNCQMFHQVDCKGHQVKWIKHASSTFSPYKSCLKPTDTMTIGSDADYKLLMEQLKSPANQVDVPSEFYGNMLENTKLQLGQTFRLVKNFWNGRSGQALAEVMLPNDASEYIIHPCLIDAMFQVAIAGQELKGNLVRKLIVPTGCKRFTWFRPLCSSGKKMDTCFIYMDRTKKCVLLLDKDGHVSASMWSLEYIETTARSVETSLQAQVKNLPEMYKVTYASVLGVNEKRISFPAVDDVCDIINKGRRDQTPTTKKLVQYQTDLDNLSSLFMTRALLTLGWKPVVGDSISLDGFLADLRIKSEYKQHVYQILEMFKTEGIMRMESGTLLISQPPPSLAKINESVDTLLERNADSEIAVAFVLLSVIGKNLDRILSGKDNPLPLLFPEDELKPSASKFYETTLRQGAGEMFSSLWTKFIEGVQTHVYPGKEAPTLRILEVGAGSGAITGIFLDAMDRAGVDYEYHFTDISTYFFPGAETRFARYKNRMVFKKLDLEVDPTLQGFSPGYYDIVIGFWVLHATRDIKESMINLHSLLRHGGNLIIGESLYFRNVLNCIFGLLDGFWRYTDFELRQHHAMLSASQWEQVGHATGFSKFAICHFFEFGALAFRAEKPGMLSCYNDLAKSLNQDMMEIHNARVSRWIIFHNDKDTEFAERLQKKINDLGRKSATLVVQPIGAYETEDYERLLSPIGSAMDNETGVFGCVDGIIITWALLMVRKVKQS